jgi:myo-inositol 2-dehydrogenase / D-chiro-inositol 1-dehydrogenase
LSVVRIGLVGCGRIAERGWIPAIARVENAELAAVADIDAARCAVVSPGTPAFTSAQDLVRAGGVDAVVVATPAAAHVSDARAVAAAGLPSIVEKPPGPDAAAARLLAALEPTPRIGLNRRFEPALLEARARVPERETLTIKLAFHYRRASWAPRVVADEALLDLGPHLIDLARWLSDSPLHRVRTMFRTRDRCTLEVELGRARASLSCATDRPYREVVEVRGANGRLVARGIKGGLPRAALSLLRPARDQLGESLAGQLEAFCTCVGGGDESQLASAADGVAIMEAIDAARRSHTLGGAWVDLDATVRPPLR